MVVVVFICIECVTYYGILGISGYDTYSGILLYYYYAILPDTLLGTYYYIYLL